MRPIELLLLMSVISLLSAGCKEHKVTQDIALEDKIIRLDPEETNALNRAIGHNQGGAIKNRPVRALVDHGKMTFEPLETEHTATLAAEERQLSVKVTSPGAPPDPVIVRAQPEALQLLKARESANP